MFQRFSVHSKAFALECTENLEEMFPLYYMHSEFFNCIILIMSELHRLEPLFEYESL